MMSLSNPQSLAPSCPIPFRATGDFSDVRDRRLFFSINSGRSGSQYLAELLGTAAKVKAFHEPEPPMHAAMLHLVNKFPLHETFSQRHHKSFHIAETLRTMQPDEVYAETNHMFIKTFYDVVLADFRNVEVIVLRRSLPHVLKSFIEMGYFSSLNPATLNWMSSPNAATAALPTLAADSELDQFDASIAYLLDIEARAQRFMQDHPEVPTHEIRLENITKPDQVEALFQQLQLSPTEATWAFVGRKVNDRPHRKIHFNNPTTLEECQRRLSEYIKRAEAVGIPIPCTLAL